MVLQESGFATVVVCTIAPADCSTGTGMIFTLPVHTEERLRELKGT
jgi:hypothetical protein